MKIVMLGPQGSGKGTQAKLISEKYGIPHISTGDIFRENIKKKTGLGKKVEAIIKSGQLVPDELTIAIVKDRISQPDCKKGFILDGFPRNISQAEALCSIVKIGKVIEVSLDDEIAVKRISSRRACENCNAIYGGDDTSKNCKNCGGKLVMRLDDTPDVVRSRLKIYHMQSKPLIDYYRKKKILMSVDGDRSVETVFAEIVKNLK